MTMTMTIVYFDTRQELIINKSITKKKICARRSHWGPEEGGGGEGGAGILVI